VVFVVVMANPPVAQFVNTEVEIVLA